VPALVVESRETQADDVGGKTAITNLPVFAADRFTTFIVQVCTFQGE